MSTDLYDETGKELTIEEVFAKLPIGIRQIRCRYQFKMNLGQLRFS